MKLMRDLLSDNDEYQSGNGTVQTSATALLALIITSIGMVTS